MPNNKCLTGQSRSKRQCDSLSLSLSTGDKDDQERYRLMVDGKKEERMGKRQGTCVHWQLQGSAQLYPKSSCRHWRPPVRIFRSVFFFWFPSESNLTSPHTKYKHIQPLYSGAIATTSMHLRSGWRFQLRNDSGWRSTSYEKHIPVEELSYYERVLEGRNDKLITALVR